MRDTACLHLWTALPPSTSWCWIAGKKRGTIDPSLNRLSAFWINSFATLAASKSQPTQHPGTKRRLAPFFKLNCLCLFFFLFLFYIPKKASKGCRKMLYPDPGFLEQLKVVVWNYKGSFLSVPPFSPLWLPPIGFHKCFPLYLQFN